MNSKLSEYIAEDSALRVLCALTMSIDPRGVREVADLCGLSPRGAQVILKKLVQLGMARKAGDNKRDGYRSLLSNEDATLLQSLMSQRQVILAHESAERYSQKKKEALDWVDPTLKALRRFHGPR